jgi:hypothetical protein
MHVGRLVLRYSWSLDTGCQADPWMHVARLVPRYRRIGWWSLDTGCQADPWMHVSRLVPRYRWIGWSLDTGGQAGFLGG